MSKAVKKVPLEQIWVLDQYYLDLLTCLSTVLFFHEYAISESASPLL